MSPLRALEPIAAQSRFGGGFDRIAARLIRGEVQRAHGRPAVGGLSQGLGLEQAFGHEPGADLAGVGR